VTIHGKELSGMSMLASLVSARSVVADLS